MSWRNSSKGWGLVSVLIHWVSALVVIGLFVLGLWMVELTYYDEWYRAAPDLHKSTGVMLLLLTLVRIIWKKTNTLPEQLNTHSDLEKKSASIVHRLMYILLFLIMFSGYLISTADGRSIDVFGMFSLPATIYDIDNQEDIAGLIHLVLAISLIVLVVVHAAGALKHHILDKDLTLKRMFGIH